MQVFFIFFSFKIILLQIKSKNVNIVTMARVLFIFIIVTGALLSRMPVPEDIKEYKITLERLITEIKSDKLFDDDFAMIIFEIESDFDKINAIYEDMDFSVANLPLMNKLSILKQSAITKIKQIEQRYYKKKKNQLPVVEDGGSISGGYSKRSDTRFDSNNTPIEYVQPIHREVLDASGNHPNNR